MSKEQLSQTESCDRIPCSSDSVYKFANGFNMKPGELAGMLYGSLRQPRFFIRNSEIAVKGS